MYHHHKLLDLIDCDVANRKDLNLPVYFAFIDYFKAFDMVNRYKLWQVLALRGLLQQLL
jgi:hypothetical protein